MINIKKFESFSHRMPIEASQDEISRKISLYKEEKLTDGELNFIRKLKEENTGYLISVGLYNFTITNRNIFIDIKKLEDDWYIVYQTYHTSDISNRFICDEWDEVLGYLTTQTNLKI
jgi:hypothetical protein